MLTNRIDLRSYDTENCSHTHDFAQLVLPLEGSMALEVEHYSGMVNDSVGVYIAPNERHCFAGSPNNLFLVIDVMVKNTLLNESVTPRTLHLTASTKKLLQFTHHYLTHHQRDFFTDSLINQLVYHFTTKSFSKEPDPMVMKAKDWMDFYCTEPVNINKVAEHCCLSISQLQRRFKQMMGCGIADYWRTKKLQQAQCLLSIKHSSIEAIAFEIGYENASAFSRRFSQVFGESPSQWRAKRLNATKMRETDN